MVPALPFLDKLPTDVANQAALGSHRAHLPPLEPPRPDFKVFICTGLL